MITQKQCSWLADKIELAQYHAYATVLPDVAEVLADLREGKYIRGSA